MLPTDYALLSDESFRPWVEKYAEDKELFFDHFSAVFAKLIELGVYRNEDGIATHDHLHKAAEYKAAPKKSNSPGAPQKNAGAEAGQLAKDNKNIEQVKSRL